MSRLTDRIFRPAAPFHTFIFIPLFYALAAIYFIGTRANDSLSSFTSRYIGRATQENFDVTSRVTQFYLSVLLFVAAFILLYLFITRLAGKKIISASELLILNLTSFCGLILLYTRMLGAEIYPGLRMLLLIHFAWVLCVVVRNIYAKQQSDTNLHFFAWMLIIAFCILFAAKKVFVLAGVRADFSSSLIIGGGFALLLVLLRKQVFSTEPVMNHSLVQVLEPLVWLPLVSVISDETYMILNQRGIFSISPVMVFSAFLLLLIGFTYMRRKRKTADFEQALSRRYFPILITGLAAFTFYSPVQNATSEMFEMANGVLPVQQFFEFGKIPLVDTFSSHMLSDFFMMLLYSVFNGYHNLCFSCYDIIFYALVTVMVYFIFRKITGGYWAFFIALFYPYAEHLVPSYVSLALLSLLALMNSQDKKSVGSYSVLFFITAFLVVWRIDLGFANAVATVATLFLVIVSNNQAVNRKALFKSILWVLSSVVILFLLSLLLAGKKILYNIQSALGYFSSAQSYGHKELTFNYDIIYYSLNYFFPVLVLAALGYALFRFFTSDSTNTKMLCISQVYLSVYYFMNFQRGLIRHGLNEQWDIPLTSFAFLIFMIWTLIFFEKKSLSYSFIVTGALVTLLISRYKFPEEELKGGGLYNSVFERIKHFPVIEHAKQKINRMPVAENFAEDNYTEIENFLDKNFSRKKLTESFADFSNTPMLYYYLHKKSPHFFAQSPLSYHNEELQERWIKEIESSGTRLVLVSSYPEIWFDVTDGVPNTLRHYFIAEYLFTHFRPGYILNNKTMWLRNDLELPDNNMDTVYSVSDIKKYSLTDAVLKESALVTGNNSPSLFMNDLSINAQAGKKYFLTMSATNLVPGEEKIYFYYNNRTVPGKESKWKYNSGSNMVFSIIPVSESDTITGIGFALTKNSQFVPHSLHVMECDYVPDYYSTASRDFDLRQFAYVWGNKDLKFKEVKHKTLRQISENTETVSNHSEKKFVFSPVEKSETGCYVILRAGKKTDDETNIIMNYGEGDSKSGGFIFSMPVGEIKNYVIRVSTQYNWCSKANNWISFYPMGGDVVIEKIEIVTGD